MFYFDVNKNIRCLYFDATTNEMYSIAKNNNFLGSDKCFTNCFQTTPPHPDQHYPLLSNTSFFPKISSILKLVHRFVLNGSPNYNVAHHHSNLINRITTRAHFAHCHHKLSSTDHIMMIFFVLGEGVILLNCLTLRRLNTLLTWLNTHLLSNRVLRSESTYA